MQSDEENANNENETGLPVELWFIAADVCDVLDIKNPTDAVARLDNDERTLATNEGNANAKSISSTNSDSITSS